MPSATAQDKVQTVTSPSKSNQFLKVHLWLLGCIGMVFLTAGMNRNGVTGMHMLLVGRQKDKNCFGEQSGNIWHGPAHIGTWTKCARKQSKCSLVGA